MRELRATVVLAFAACKRPPPVTGGECRFKHHERTGITSSVLRIGAPEVVSKFFR